MSFYGDFERLIVDSSEVIEICKLQLSHLKSTSLSVFFDYLTTESGGSLTTSADTVGTEVTGPEVELTDFTAVGLELNPSFVRMPNFEGMIYECQFIYTRLLSVYSTRLSVDKGSAAVYD